jgi:gliding motility-associated-like protein
LNGNDVVYSFTPTFTGTINVAMTPTGTWSGIFAYSSCANIGVNCLAGVANSGSTIRTFDLPVTIGSTYYFVISTWPAPQTTGYTLVINRINCVQPTNATVSGISSDSALASWGNPGGATSWQVAVQPAGTGIPTGSGVVTNTNTNSPLSGLTPLTNYEYYVRADCGDGTFSLWTGPVPFTTAAPPPVCGGNFFDAGGPTANYPNVITDNTTTICPTNPGDVVTVTFTSFDTEATWDGLYVFDGNTIGAPQIPSANPGGNVNGGLAGSFWGLLTGANLPGPFTASNASGCLTFRFRTDDFGSGQGWSANVTCSPAPNCLKPTTLTATNVTSTSALLGWTEPSPTTVTQWEVLVLPFGSPAPLPSTTGGIIISSNPSLITGLLPGTQYTYYVRGICSTSGTSLWSTGFNFTTLIINDNCDGAIFAPVNGSLQCQQVTPGTINGATASLTPPIAPCIGTADDDVWFQFIASNTYLNISLLNVVGNTNLNFAVYSGVCGTLTQRYCSAANSLNLVLNNLILGQTYFIRVYSNANTAQTSTFDLCITTPSTCANSNTICNLLGENTPSTVGITSLGTIGCLTSSPNPTFYTLEVANTGPINLFMSQNALPNGQGVGRDIDYAAWGPFTSQTEACSVVGNQFPFAPPGIGVPVTQTTGCSFSAASTETFNIANAQAGQIYIILITNFSQQPGFINLVQTNFGQPGAGTVNCCPEAFFQYQPSSYCKTPGNPNPIAVITPGSLAGVFSSPFTPGLVFTNTSTGEIDLMASAPGNYVIVNTIPASGTCQSKQRTYTINISEPTSATISYGSNSPMKFCKSITALQPVTQTGTPGGSYSAIPNVGLSINPTTGDINPSLSSPGIYNIVYGLPGSICTSGNPSTQVEIIALPNIVQPAPIVACNSTLLPALTVGNYYSQSQLTGAGTTPLDVSVPITTNQTIYIYTVGAEGCSNEKSFNVTINTVPTPTFTTTASSCSPPNGTITVTSPIGTTAPTPASLFISEVTDANTGSLTYVEIYNGTGAPVNLTNYKLRTFNNGSATFTAGCDNVLSGTLANNSVHVVSIGTSAITTGVVPNQTFNGCTGVNEDDCIKLMTLSNTVVDLWGRTDGIAYTPTNQPGYTYRRLASAPHPSTTWNAADWTALDPEDYTNIGSYSLAISNYEYSIDSGAFQSNPLFTGLASGPHILVVKDINTDCTTSLNVTIDVTGGSALTSLTGVTPVCSGGDAVFTLTGTPNATVTYTINSGSNQTVVLDATGNGTVTVNAVTANTVFQASQIGLTGCDVPINNTATVVINPNPTFGNLTATTPVCSGGNAEFTLTGTPNATVTYTINSGGNQTVVLDATGNGTVTVNAVTANTTILLSQISLASCNKSITNTATVVVNPNPTFGNLTGTSPVCSGGNAVFTLTGTPNATITYTINSGGNQTVVLDAIGNGTVTVNAVTANTVFQASQISLTGCDVPINNTATVVVNPNPTFGNLTATTPVCSGGNAEFTLTGTPNATVTYTINSGANQTIVLDAAGNGTVTVNAVTANTTILLSQISLASCNKSITNTDTVVVNPNPTFGNLTATTPVCYGGDAEFTLTGTPNATVTYTINSGANQTVVLDATGNGTVTVNAVTANTTILLSQISLASCNKSITNTATVVVNPLPQVAIAGSCVGSAYTLTANPVNGSFDPLAATYSWEDSSGNPIGSNTQSVIVTQEGDYTVNVISVGCTGSAMFSADNIRCVIQKGISVNNDDLNDTFDLTGFDVKKLTIFNRLGMKVYSLNNYVDEWGGKSDDGDELPDGTYYYVIEQRSGTVKTGWIYINRAQ